MMAAETPPALTGRGPVAFISYAHADRDRITPLTEVLMAAGQQVWWDGLIEGGEAFAKTIESALDLADAVVVAWSVHSVTSDWVRDEAAHGRDRGRLVPISLDGTAPPLGFRQYHFIDFSRWRGSADAPEIKALLSALAAARTGRPDHPRTAPPSMARNGPGRRALLIGGGIGVVALGGGLTGWRLLSRQAAPENSIAVLPFANLSGDASQGYFSDGLSEELRARLGEAGGFKVAAQTSSDHFRNHDNDAVTIGHQLGVAYLLDGSVRRAGDTLRVSAELIEAQSGLSKWTQSFDRRVDDIFAVQTEIATTVIQAVTGQIPAATAALIKTGTTVLGAYDAYLKGRAFFSSDDGEQADRKALASFDEAIGADPNYAQAYVMRAETLMDLAGDYTRYDQIPGVYAEALAAAQRAVSLAPKLASAHLAVAQQALYARLDFRAARPYFEKALALGPQDPKVLGQYAYFMVRAGRIADALSAVDKSIDLDRLNPFAYLAKGHVLHCARRDAEAIRIYGQALAMNPRMGQAHAETGFSLLALGEVAAARDAFSAEPDDYQKWTGLAIVAHRTGDPAGARQVFAALQQRYGDTMLYQQGLILTQWGQIEQALATLERARKLNDGGLIWALTEVLLDPLHGQPRFKALLASMGLS
jgi:TolB-like protein/tetratricopeptide (TPR) repeat protein